MDRSQPTGYRAYDPDPTTPTGPRKTGPGAAASGYAALVAALAARLGRPGRAGTVRGLVSVDVYHAPQADAFLAQLRAAWEADHGPAAWFDTRQALKAPARLQADLQEFLTDDPVFGRVCDRDLSLFFDPVRWQQLAAAVEAARRAPAPGAMFVVGPGALLSPLRLYSDAALYALVPRESIFFASEAGRLHNLGDDQERGRWPRYKRSFYVDWPVQNRHLFEVLPACDYLVDMTDAAAPAHVDTRRLLDGLAYAAQRPFRLRSLFMPGVWGGQRLRELVPGLPDEWPNCAWGFEVVAPENSLALDFDGTRVQVPFELGLHFEAARVLGLSHYRRFGEYFPIRFDFLDTIGGTNLSCQVHPPDAYINAHFREPFAQHEMYYILENRPGAQVFLGLQADSSREAFVADVVRAQSEQVPFEISQHVNAWEARPGDLFVIPAGTVHCSGADNLVLEISATPYIYTFKIYDYLRADLDGKPRPISYERALEVIDFGRTTGWVREHLLARPRVVAEGEGWRRLALADAGLVFHAVERLELTAACADTTERQGVHVLCVVAGQGVRLVRAADGAELALTYAETAIIPAACGAYRLEPIGSDEVQVVKCYVPD